MEARDGRLDGWQVEQGGTETTSFTWRQNGSGGPPASSPGHPLSGEERHDQS